MEAELTKVKEDMVKKIAEAESKAAKEAKKIQRMANQHHSVSVDFTTMQNS